MEGESMATCTLGSPIQSDSESTDSTESESTDASPTKKQRVDDSDEESSNSSPGGRTTAEVEKTPKEEGDQCIAETIVFSLLQKQRHPEFENHIVPNIYIDQYNFRIFMYDADGDFLISTALVPLFYEGTLSPAAIICLWMVLHYRLFCTKIREGERLKSRFMELTNITREIYSNSLKFHVSSFPTQKQHSLPDILDPFNFHRDEN
ncbi:uncharacterized protein LOC133171942 [Saccostrea echinata]|uniref:uncharacterized protein LOC133171942 n=1 Tax=Saccostrea echinata TaxID=191078 RepID=UPI002A80ABAD|nr:uncharacterized protein LOC133171942 [Saccostrea echinata]